MKFFLCLYLFLALAACASGGYPETAVQFCLSSDDDLNALKVILRKREKGGYLVYGDRSEHADRELRSIADAREVVELSSPIINISVLSKSGRGVTVSNLGLPANQVVLAVYAIDGEEDLNEGILADVKKRWNVVPLPRGADAVPIPNCARASLTPSWISNGTE